MFDPDAIERIRMMRRDWEANELSQFLLRQPESRSEYRTASGLPVERVYTPADIADTRFEEIGLPGGYPFTRGPYPTMYRGRLWTMRQIAGYGTGSDTNKRFRYLIRPSLRLVRDMIVYSAEHMARYNPINISGYHISEAGATSVQEVAFTMANAIAYVEEVTRAGVPVDRFAPRLAFYFIAQADFFEEVAKFRAARRIWAKLMKARFGAAQAESMRLRFHCQTAAATLTKAQPMNNIVRTALQALAAVLGGAQSLHTNGLDEAYAIPSELAMKIALRTQQIIADETRVTAVVDPLGGSYYVEALTSRIEAEVAAILRKVDALGGTVKAIEEGYFQREIADSAYAQARRKASGAEPVIGVNKFVEPPAPGAVEIHRVDPAVEARQIERLRATRASRDHARVAALLERLAREAADPAVNLIPVTIELVEARASMGEIVGRLRHVWGQYVETPVF